MWQLYVIDPLRGRMPLARVIWIYCVGVTVAMLLLEPLFTGSKLLHRLFYGFGILVSFLQPVMLWQCAYNTKSRAYGSWIRLVAVLGVLLLLGVLYVLWRHPEIMQLVE